MDEIKIYKTPDGNTQVNVRFDKDTVWLSQAQLVELFESSKANISEHLKNVFKSGELDEGATVRKFRTVRQEGNRDVTRNIEHYNLDVIISVGYRVNTKRGIQFRQWATQRLKDYLVKGYTINQNRLEQLHQTIQLISEGGKIENLQINEAKGLLEIIQNYSQSFILLNQFDSNKLVTEKLNKNITYEIQYAEAKSAIATLKMQLIKRNEAAGLFGNEKDEGFKCSLLSVTQTFGGQYLYPSIEEQASNLLYFIIKNHSFTDGISKSELFYLFGF